MLIDEQFLIAFFAGFIRCTAVMLASPFVGNNVPVQVRILLGAVISLSLGPVITPFIGSMPESVYDLAALGIREALAGLAIGLSLQFLSGTFMMAGSFLDLQVGIGSAQILNPSIGTTVTPIGNFKFWLSLVLLFLLNAHHMMFQAIVSSYKLPGIIGAESNSLLEPILQTLSSLLMISLQIAGPVVAVTIIIDIAAGIINKAVPQTQPFLLSLPAKLALGLGALSIGLPTLIILVQRAVEVTFDGIGRVLGG